jgi:UDP-glucose 4-epimerase
MPSLAGRRIAVVGGTGFIGSHLVERLVAEGAEVLALARTPARLMHLASVNTDCAVAIADVCDPEPLRRMFRRWRPDVVFHLAAHPDASESFEHVVDCVRINGLGLVNVLQAAALSGAEVFVYGGSAKDYGNAAVPYRASQVPNPVCSYAMVKAAGWQLCQLATSFTDLHVVALRPTLVYGPRQNRNIITYVHDCVTAGRPVRLMGGSQTRDPLYIDDAVNAFVLAAAEPRAWGHAIPIGGGQELSVSSLCEAVMGALGANARVVADAEQSRLTEIWRSSSDNADAHRLLGWEPRVTLSEGLACTIADWIADASPVTRRPVAARPGHYLAEGPGGVPFRMVDRRELADRRSLPRGGRRASDVVVRLTEDASRAASLAEVL